MGRLTVDEVEILRASIQIYISRLTPSMDEFQLALARFQAANEARAMYEHIVSMDVLSRNNAEVVSSISPEERRKLVQFGLHKFGTGRELKREMFREALQRLGKLNMVAKEFQISSSSVHNWMKQFGKDFVRVGGRWTKEDLEEIPTI